MTSVTTLYGFSNDLTVCSSSVLLGRVAEEEIFSLRFCSIFSGKERGKKKHNRVNVCGSHHRFGNFFYDNGTFSGCGFHSPKKAEAPNFAAKVKSATSN